ncbi:MAG: YebC/PmpR family DNA-binding transcriptional regulator [Clostridia bacterium]|nr:YebC/PmpR family DNA-binding transcriptional regulator [Clostridia bacterium]
MSGHSKWSNIKHRKEAQDAVRGKVFTRIGKEIVIAVKEGGPDPSANNKLKTIIAKAKASNMPNDTIEKAIKKAANDKDSTNYDEIIYEGYGPNGVAIIVETLTDNKNRTAANVRHAFTKGNGNMGTTGCVSFMFDKKGQILIEKEECPMGEDDLMMLVLDAGADDFSSDEEGYEILTTENDFTNVMQVLDDNNIKYVEAEVKMLPQTMTKLTDEESIKRMNMLLDLLDEDDDVQNVYHNWDEE